ncbi:MAG: (Fe-S)-binding protein [Syntrophomonadaceae bacterium]|jgi:glycolate oxidase iron-sulfur subunit|nr:(Fe-S)-binding protein [Syntrophomonadaceae bacterium]
MSMYKLEEYESIIEKCSHCSYCQSTCPSYLSQMSESHVAKNRLLLIKETVMHDRMPYSKKAQELLDTCLLCTNCTQTCSSKVPIVDIIIAARIKTQEKSGGIKQTVMSKMLAQRGLTGVLTKAGSLAQKMGIATKEVPPLAAKSFDKMYSGTYTPSGEVKKRVAYFVGCGTNFFFPDTGEATVKVLNHNGMEVVIPPGQVCCGIPTLSEGDLEGTRSMLETNMKILADLDVDAIITDCTSCGMMFKEKAAKCLPEGDPLQEKIAAVAGKMWEVTEYLQTEGLAETPGQLDIQWSYHVPCHRGWSPTVKDAPRKLLAQIPNARLNEFGNPEQCCGGAGTYYMEHREEAEKIRDMRLQDINQTESDAILTQCPVCRFYIGFKVKDREVTHPIKILARSYGL